MRILVKFATRAAATFFAVLNKWVNFTTNANTRFLITVDDDDATMTNAQSRAGLASYPNNVEVLWGKSKNKIDAINRGMGYTKCVRHCGGGERRHELPQVRGWDDHIIANMAKHFPKLDGALHYYDGYCGDAHLCTLTVMGVELYKRFGYIYYPEYQSLYCDTEYTDVIKAWNVWQYIPEVIIRHEHVGQTPDALYRHNPRNSRRLIRRCTTPANTRPHCTHGWAASSHRARSRRSFWVLHAGGL